MRTMLRVVIVLLLGLVAEIMFSTLAHPIGAAFEAVTSFSPADHVGDSIADEFWLYVGASSGLAVITVLVGRRVATLAAMGIRWKGTLLAFALVSPLMIINILALVSAVAQDEVTITWQSVVAFTILAIAVGFGEEFFFRGLLFHALVPWRHPAVAVFVSAVIFGLLHVVGAGTAEVTGATITNAAAVTLLVGVPFALIRYRTGNIIGLALAHTVFDIFGLLAIGGTELPERGATSLVASIIMAGMVCVLALAVFHRSGGYRNRAEPAGWNQWRTLVADTPDSDTAGGDDLDIVGPSTDDDH